MEPELVIEPLDNAPDTLAPDVETLRYGVVPTPMRTALLVSVFERHTSPTLPFR